MGFSKKGVNCEDFFRVGNVLVILLVYQAAIVYDCLPSDGLVFQADPNTKNFFKIIKDMNEEQLTKSIMFKAHVVNVMSAINSAVLNLDHPEIVMALMNKLGVSHHKQNVRVQDFQVLKVVLINILKNDLKMNDASLESWTRFVDFIYQHIFVKLYDSQKLL